MFDKVALVMLAILTIPHCNAACERIFSQVRKNKTAQRDSMGPDTLDAILVLKGQPGGYNPSKRYSPNKLRKLKSCYYESLKKYDQSN